MSSQDIENIEVMLFCAILICISLGLLIFINVLFVKLKGRYEKSKLLLMLQNTSISVTSLVVSVIIIEIIMRFSMAIYHKEPVLFFYPLGFKEDGSAVTMYYDRIEPTIKIVDGLEVPLLSSGKERWFLGNIFWRATIGSNVGLDTQDGGYRGKMALTDNVEGKKIIFVIGGSSTYGVCNDDETFPAQLESYLNSRSRQKYLVFNLGIRAMSSRNFLGRLKNISIHGHQYGKGIFILTPDIIVIYSGNNDTIPNALVNSIRNMNNAIRNSALEPLMKYSLFFRWIISSLIENFPTIILGKDFFSQELNKPVVFNITQAKDDAEQYKNRIKEIISYYAGVLKRKVIYVEEYMDYKIDSLKYKGLIRDVDINTYEAKQMKYYDLLHLRYYLFQSTVKKYIDELGDSNVIYLEPTALLQENKRAILIETVHLNRYGNSILAESIGEEIIKFKRK